MKNNLQHNNFKNLRQRLMQCKKQGLMICTLLLTGMFSPAAAIGATVDLATVPLATATTTSVLPNLMFTLDDSGSMDWNYLPDWVNDDICKSTSGAYTSSCNNQPPYRSSDFNAIYYNPAIRYMPAVSASGGKVNTSGDSTGSQTTWTSVKNDAYNIQDTGSTNLVTGYTDVEWCTSTSYTDCLRNDNYILPGIVNGKNYQTPRASVKATGSGSVATGALSAPTTSARTWGPHYYTIIPGEYCDSIKLTNCQATETATFKYPAKVRWCDSPALSSCRAVRAGAFIYPRYPTVKSVNLATITVGGSGSTSVSSITVDGKQILSGGTSNSTSLSTVASRIAAKINSCTSGISGSCTVAGYSATSSGSIVTIVAPVSSSPITFPLVITKAGGMSLTTTDFKGGGVAPGSFKRTDIVTGKDYPKVVARTDCTGAVGPAGCSYSEEMTNFANWWTYYQTRMQAMKTATSLAFGPIDSRYRVGFNAISYTGATDGAKFLHIDTFNAGHKAQWYAKLFGSDPSSYTPLRGALSKTGQIFAKKLTGAADPVQYSCQQNFTILSTDGYWNTNDETATYGPYNLTGGNVGNRDTGSVPLPMHEGDVASNTLADVAKYYYDTDLRDPGNGTGNCTGALGLDVCENNVFVSGSDNNVKQHMTTFTLGLGVSGTLLYTDDYKTAKSGDYYDLRYGFGTPVVQWPDPIANDSAERIDDLWHAAVNGQGTYFSAQDPAELRKGLSAALSQINAKVGAGAAAATSTLNPVAGDDSAYVASYTTVKWAGNLEARSIDLATGAVSEAAQWCVEDVVDTSCAAPNTVMTPNSGANYYCVTPSATSCSTPGFWGDDTTIPSTSCAVEMQKPLCTGKLRGQVSDGTRSIKMNVGGTLGDFTYDNLNATQKLNFQSTFLSTHLSQWNYLDPATQQSIAKETNLVNYLRGDKGFEDSGSNAVVNRVFRYREAVMGDALESAPVFVGKPNFNYLETSYAGFKATSRTNTVYLGTNDGMLHAFNAANGKERWAYVPSMVIPNMWKLADKNYATMHTHYVNGTTTVADVCSFDCANSGDWKTILVGGLNGGGQGYYALDVTGDTPTLLWEFDTSSDSDMGYSFGNPVITKLKPDGTYPLGRWVVLLTSGYNNTAGSGEGILYVLDATSGAVIRRIQTSGGAGSGLAKIAAFIDAPSKNNEAVYVYGGDLLGNLWRFDINTDGATGSNPLLLATLKDNNGNAQPITTRPELGKIDGNRVVFVGTGKYLEMSDLTDTQQQTIYAIKDTGTFFDNARNYLTPQIMSSSGATRSAPNSTVNAFTSGNGWYVDLPEAKAGEGSERQNVQGRLVSGTLVVPTTVPSNAVCSPGGYGWVNYFNYKNGGGNGTTPGSGIVSSKTNAPPVGINIVYIDGKPVGSVTTADDATPKVVPVEFGSNASGFAAKRAIWRELIE